MNAKAAEKAAPQQQLLQVRFFGGFSVSVGGVALRKFSYDKLRVLLAYLVMQPQEQRREHLAKLFWPTVPATTARGNLRRCLFDLRAALAELGAADTGGKSAASSVDRSPKALRFPASLAHHVDVMDFLGTDAASAATPAAELHRLEQRMALYRGEFLAGLFIPDCPELNDWLQRQREILHRQALTLLDQLYTRYGPMGQQHKVLQAALRYTELAPWDEEGHRRVMRDYASMGHSGAALSQYACCCSLLKQELGVLPSEETRQLAEQIRLGAPVKGWHGTRPRRHGPAGEPAQSRQVTVVYCELVHAVMDDPDEVMALLRAPQARCVEIMAQFSGHVVQAHGGGLLAYFGYPQAHEEVAHRAVLAALALTGEAAPGVGIRAGVHTGLIMTGRDSSMPDTSGRTTRIAMALSHRPAQHPVVISQDTHHLVAGYFDCHSLGAQTLPGGGHEQDIFEVVRENGVRTRLDAAAQLTPLIGRKAEIMELVGLWQASTQGACHVVLLEGEAGIGKSRLLHTLKQRLADQPHVVCELRCFPEFSQSPFHPLLVMLERLLDFVPGDSAAVRSGKLVAYLETRFPASVATAVPLLTGLFSLPLDQRYALLGSSPSKQKEQINRMLMEMVHALAVQRPVLFLVEDLHWMDPSTLEWLTLFIEQKGSQAILAILTARPDFDPPWPSSLERTLVLAPLGVDEMMRMMAALRPDMPVVTRRRIVGRADGVPLFVEEMAKMASSGNPASIPATLHDLLASRIDSLGDAKTTAQLAATIGRQFNLAVLTHIAATAPNELARSLRTLEEAGLIVRVDGASCQFRHALIQEAAYQSQTRLVRQASHQRIAQTLLSHFPDVIAVQPELLARHLSAGGDTRQAVDYWLKAGQRAVLSSAHLEALDHLNTGLQLLLALPPSAERDRLVLTTRTRLGAILIAVQGYGSVEAGAEYTQATQLAEALGERSGLFRATWGLWLGASSCAGHGHALQLAKKLLQLAQRDQDPLHLQKAHYAMGNSLLWTGRLSQARRHQEQGMALYQTAHHDIMVRELGENICVSTGSQLTWVLWLQGFPDQARVVGEKTLALAREVNHPYSQCYACAHVMVLQRWLRQIGTTRQMAEDTMVQAHQHGFPLWLLTGTAFQGWAVTMQGQGHGVAQLQSGVATVRAAMGGVEAFFLVPLLEAQMRLGQWQEALSTATTALAVAQARDDRFQESEILRLQGECLLGQWLPDVAAAEACFGQALTICQQQGAKSLELRVATSLGRLWLSQGKQAQAQQLLGAVSCWFTEGLDTPDYQDAQCLWRRCRSEVVR
ncbi:BTAD domain-containing putative transcriptional regulator [Rhodoferax sp.]|uniref:BTAD domain-containing putative transcriptional regulator n=1 Tax=Rhodoferax sp. TaxID=50421 RepID=UPI00262D17CE|nr:BTAD domain-containing putative transcriptional regulator [Rhodoferax sp.]MDD2924453.1 BTAD domain-containing putative transcriptional regulator [Rhodoferax sp.]